MNKSGGKRIKPQARGEWDLFFAEKNFSGRGVKIFEVRESNPKILRGGVSKFQLGESECICKKKFLEVGESKLFRKGSPTKESRRGESPKLNSGSLTGFAKNNFLR